MSEPVAAVHTNVGSSAPASRTPLWAVCALSFLCSIGTGIVWAGIPFIAKHDYDISKQNILALYLTLGFTYVLGALCAGAGLRKIERSISPRSVLLIIMVVCTLASLSLMLSEEAWMLWAVAITINIATSWLWPIVESYVTSGKHGRSMRNALGAWNLTWTTAVVMSLFLMAPLVAEHARWSLIGTAGVYLLSMLTLLAFSAKPGAHGDAGSDGSEQREYPQLLRSARWLLLTSYVLNSAMSPLLPFLIARLGVFADWATPIAATWTGARVLAMAVMWRSNFWHGRWGTLLTGGLMMAIGFTTIVAAFTLPMLIVGLAVIGAGMGIVYYATLYYTMTVGSADVDAGGRFEALIGLGYTAGPAAGLLGVMFTEQFADTALGPDGGVVIAALAIMFAASLLAARPYFAASKAR